VRIAEGVPLPTDRYWADPGLVMSDAGIPPDPWQRRVLESTDREMLLLCTRQAGKSTTMGALICLTAMLYPRALVLILSPTQRQSCELLQDKVVPILDAIGWPVPGTPKATSLRLANGSRVVALPDNERGIRCYSSVSLLVIDEASKVSDHLFRAVTPMLVVSRGRAVALSTPFGQRGWFYDEWVSQRPWTRVRVTTDECPRHTPEFVASERAKHGERWVRQEYYCSFEANVDQYFAQEDIDAALSHAVTPLFGRR